MPPPAFVVCELCHKQFGKTSIGIHMKACVAKREASTTFCPVCDLLVSNDEYEKHFAECKITNADMYKKKKEAEAASRAKAVKQAATTASGPLAINGSNKPQATNTTTEPEAAKRSKVPEHILRKMKEMAEPPETRLMRRLGGHCDACGSAIAIVLCLGCHAVYCSSCSAGVHSSNKALADHSPIVKEDVAMANKVEAEKNAAADLDGRVSCNICDRKFGADRIAKHQLVCTKIANKKTRKPFMSAEEARLKGTDFEKFLKEHGGPAPVEPPPEHKEPKWKQQHEEMMHVVSQAKESAAEPIVESKEEKASDAAVNDTAEKPGDEIKKTGLRIGDKVVVVEKGLVGTLQFKGPIWGLKKGNWLGIEFHDAPVGRNDGSYLGVQYFYCSPNHGLFIRPEKVRAYVEGEVVMPQPLDSLPQPTPAKPAPTAAVPQQPKEADPGVSESKEGAAEAADNDDFKIEIHVAPAKSSPARAPKPQQPSIVQPSSAEATKTSDTPAAAANTHSVPAVAVAPSKPSTAHSVSRPAAAPASTQQPPSNSTVRPLDVSKTTAPPVTVPVVSGGRTINVAGATTQHRPQSGTAEVAPRLSNTARVSNAGVPVTAARSKVTGATSAAETTKREDPKLAVVSNAAKTAAPSSRSAPRTNAGVTSRPPTNETARAPVSGRTSSGATPGALSSTTGLSARGGAVRPQQQATAASTAAKDTTKRGASTGPVKREVSARSTGPTASSATTTSARGALAETARGKAISTTVTNTTRKPERATSSGPTSRNAPARLPPHLAAAAAAQARAAEAARLAAEQNASVGADVDVVVVSSPVNVVSVPAKPVVSMPHSPVQVKAAASPATTQHSSRKPVEEPSWKKEERSPIVQRASVANVKPAGSPPKPAKPATTTTTAVAGHTSPGSVRPSTATSRPGTGDKSLVSRLRRQVEVERAPAPSVSAISPTTKAAILASAHDEPDVPTPPRRVAPQPVARSEAPPQKSVADSEAEARARDIARNVDFLRVLAGEKSRLADDPTKENVGFVAFGGGGHRIAESGSSHTTEQTNLTGEKRRVVKDGFVTIAKGLSDADAEREKRAAAARARLLRGTSEGSAT